MTQSIHLQGIGQFTAKPAGELQVGDTTVWNYGSTAKVETVAQRGKSVFVTLKTEDGKVWPERRLLASRLVACTGLGGKTYMAGNGEELPQGAAGTTIVNDGRPC